MNKFLYFRTVADEANDGVTGLNTNIPSSFLFPADSLTAMQPTADAVLTLYFKPALANNNSASPLRDTVDLNVNEGDHFEVMSKITDAIANPARGHSDGFIVIADDVVTTDAVAGASPAADSVVAAQYIHNSITSCGAITVQSPSAGYGVHEHYEVVDITAAATADDDVLDPLSIYIPAQAALVEAMLINVELSTNAEQSCALEVHSSAQVHNAGSGGTEIIGAAVASLPAEDLNFGSGDVIGDVVTGGTLISHESPLFRGTAISHFALAGKESAMTNTGTAKIGVYLKWYGPAAVAI